MLPFWLLWFCFWCLVWKSFLQSDPYNFFYCVLFNYSSYTIWRYQLSYLLVHQLPLPLLLGPTRWSSFNRRLNRLDTTRPPHILPFDRCNYWLITGFICGDMKTPMHILLSFLPIEEYAGNCMGTWYASRMPFPATTMSFFHVHSETLQSTFNLKLCMTCPISKPLVACNLFPMRSLKHFRTYLWFHSHDLLSVILKPGLKI